MDVQILKEYILKEYAISLINNLTNIAGIIIALASATIRNIKNTKF